MRNGWWPLALLTVPALAFLWVPVLAAAYADRPPPAHTGGFDEPSCHACHFDAPLDDGKGGVEVTGAPDSYRQGETYEITITVTRPEMVLAGFQVAARFAEGERAGRQAGTWDTVDDRVEIVEASDVEYAHHTPDGTELSGLDRAQWTLEWTAPADTDAPVVFHAVGNAANGDDSEFGDFIYLTELVSRVNGARK